MEIIDYKGTVIDFSRYINQKEYERAKSSFRKAVPEQAENIIQIIEAESSDYERRNAFLSTTIEAILNGADYTGCKTIKDMSKIYAKNLTTRLGF